MPLKLMYITNNADIALIAEASGVDWIFVDLEKNGKVDRQGHLDTVISSHSLDDVARLRSVLTLAKLLVRVNPIYESSAKEIDDVVSRGADIIMLPFFKSIWEAQEFVGFVAQRARTCLLLETPEAVDQLDSLLAIDGVDCIHIGLNDLHMGYKKHFMFELLADGTVEMICNKIKEHGIPYGFGGIARLGQGTLPAENILAEHYRLGSNMAILSRSFCNPGMLNDLAQVRVIFAEGVRDIRVYEQVLSQKEKSFFEENAILVRNKVNDIVRCISLGSGGV